MATETQNNVELDSKGKAKRKQMPAKVKNIIFLIIAVALFAGVGIWYYNYWDAKTYFRTENAKITAQTYAINPTTAGRLLKYTVGLGSSVKENEVIGRVENGGYIKSPINGQVIKSNVTLNQLVSPSTVVAIVADTSNMYIQANIEETDIIKIKEGQYAEVKIDAFPGKNFKARVYEIDKTTQTALTGGATSFNTSGTYTKVTQLIPVKIKIDDNVNLDGLIGANAYVTITIK